MARKDIGTGWDRNNRNAINDNFEELYKSIRGEVASISTEKIIDKAVVPEKTTFVKRSKNLFNKNNVITGYRLIPSTGELEVHDDWATSEYIPIRQGRAYKKSHISHHVQYDAHKKWISGSGANNNSLTGVANVAFIRVSMRKTDLNNYQLEEGSQTTNYEDYGLKMDSLIGMVSQKEVVKQVSQRIKSLNPITEYPDIIHELLPAYEKLSISDALMEKSYTSWVNHDYGIMMKVKGAKTAILSHSFSEPKNIIGVQAVGAWVYIEDATKVDNIVIGIGHKPSGHQWERSIRSFKNGWNLIRHKSASGSIGDWNTFYRFRILIVTNNATKVTIGSLFMEQTEKAKLLFIEDGGYIEFLENGYPALKERGIPTTWALTPGRLGNGRVITEEQVDELAEDYMSSFSFHSWASEPHSTMTREEVADNAIKCVRWLQRKGLMPDHLYRAAITQNNAPNHEVLQEIVEAYSSPTGSSALEVFPFMQPFGTPRITLHGNSKEQIDNLFEQMKKTHCLMIGYTHGIQENKEPGDMSFEQWRYFLQKIDEGLSEGWLEGVTYDQLRKRYSRPSNGWGFNNLINAT